MAPIPFRLVHATVIAVAVVILVGVVALSSAQLNALLVGDQSLSAGRLQSLLAVRVLAAAGALLLAAYGLLALLRPCPVRAAWRWLIAEARPSLPCLAGALAVGGAVLIAVFVLHRATGAPIDRLTRDVTTVAGVASYTGLLSTLGVLLWAATTAICLFSAWLLRGEPSAAACRRLFIAAGLFSLWLMADDQFQLHEVVLPGVFGIPEKLALALYPLGVLAIGVGCRRTLRHTPYPMLVVGLACLALSMTIDTLFHNRVFLEDGLKFIGIVCWFAYFARTASAGVASRARGDTVSATAFEGEPAKGAPFGTQLAA